jgi:hypothetical protein
MKLFKLLLCLCILSVSFAVADARKPQTLKYLIFNSSIDVSTPEAAVKGFKEIASKFEKSSQKNVKIGVSRIFSYLSVEDPRQTAGELRNFLYASSQTQVPVLIKLDGEQWWQGRPDLWNWWDPEKPGYDPENAKNVEWTWWSPQHAIKIAWRNWGRQIRVLPPPNLMSPAYRTATHEGMDILMPIVMDWQKSLPEDKKYLFVGINVGWESSLCYNAIYYPNGNEYLDKPVEDDPQYGAVRADVLSRGLVQTGYAALKTSGIRTSGDITEDDLVEVVRRHLEDLAKYAHDFGFPRDKIFTHGVGNENGEKLYDAAVNEYSCPGWSGYWYADDPSKDAGIMRNIKKSDAPSWAIVEWLLLKPYKEKELWQSAFESSLSYPGCKFIAVYNWEGVHSEGSRVIEAANGAIQNLNTGEKNAK